MNLTLIKSQVSNYPLASLSCLISIASLALVYWRWDVESNLSLERDLRSKMLQAIIIDESNAKNILRDVDRAKSLYDKVVEKSLDFDSTISAQGFFADFVQRAAVKTEGLPVQDSLASLVSDAKPMAFCAYKMHVSADFQNLLKFLASFEEHPDRAMVISRVQLTEADLTQKTSALIGADIAFRLWGRKGDMTARQPISDKKVVPTAQRNSRLVAAEKCITPDSIDLSAVTNPFYAGSDHSREGGESDSDSNLENALHRLKFSIELFLGTNVVKIAGNSPKRINNDFEVNVDGKLQKVKIIAITKDSFTVQTSTGGKIKISLKQ